jgi:hypothetical protein
MWWLRLGAEGVASTLRSAYLEYAKYPALVNIKNMLYIGNMGRPPTHPIKKLISLTEAQAQAISDYRFDGRFPSENEAIRDLIEKGLSVAIANQKTDNQSK